MSDADVRKWGLRALGAALDCDEDDFYQPDTCIAFLNPEQREELLDVLEQLVDICEGMRGAS